MSSPTLQQRGGRSPKTRGSKKRSSSGTFASLFATLTSFSSSNSSGGNAAAPASADIGKSPPFNTSHPSTPSSPVSKSLPGTAHGNEHPVPFDMSRRRPGSKSSVPTTKPPPPETRIVARPSTAQKQVVKHVPPASKSSGSVVAVTSAKPDVFSFMSGEISTPPTPRPRGGLPRGLGITGDRPLERSAGGGQISAPTPRRPVVIPKSPSTIGSPSDSGLSSDSDSEGEEEEDDDDDDDDDDSGPNTPRPEDQRALIASARRSLERMQGQDAVGRSIRSEDYYRKVGRNHATPPPEAPMVPNFQQSPTQQQQLQQHHHHHQNPPTLHHQVPNYDYHLSSPAFDNFHDSPSIGGMGGSFSMPYPTPPLESNALPSLPSPKVPAAIDAPPFSNRLADSPTLNKTVSNADTLPRQYRILTQTTIKRTEVIIDNLEAELRGLDKAAPTWQREQLVMRLSNTLIMHHRLVDIWSKISQLSRLTMSRIEDREKIEAVWSQLRQQYSHVSQVNGLGVDKFISNIVTDLVNVGERAQITAKADNDRAPAESPDTKVIVLLLGLILIFLLLRDEIFQKFFIVAGVIVGLYTLLQQNGSKKANTIGGGNQG